MGILEQEFTRIARQRARGELALDNNAVVLYLFLARTGLSAGRFESLEVARSAFAPQGLSRYLLNKAIRALCDAGLLEYTAGTGRTASLFTLPRLMHIRPAAAQPEAPVAQPSAHPNTQPTTYVAPPPPPASVTTDEALRVLAGASATVRRLCAGVVTPAAKESLAAQLPRMGATRAEVLSTLAAVGGAVEESDYLRENLTIGWLAAWGNWEKVLNGNYKTRAKARVLTEWERNGGAPPGDYESFVAQSEKEWRRNDAIFRCMEDGVERNCHGQTREEARIAEIKRREAVNRAAMEEFKRRTRDERNYRQLGALVEA